MICVAGSGLLVVYGCWPLELICIHVQQERDGRLWLSIWLTCSQLGFGHAIPALIKCRNSMQDVRGRQQRAAPNVNSSRTPWQYL